MTLRKLYDDMGGDYDQVMARLGGARGEQLLCKLLNMLPADPCMTNLKVELEKKDYEAAFRTAHTYKGVVSNLGLKPLLDVAEKLTEQLRQERDEEQVLLLFRELKQWNEKVLQDIDQLTQKQDGE